MQPKHWKYSISTKLSFYNTCQAFHQAPSQKKKQTEKIKIKECDYNGTFNTPGLEFPCPFTSIAGHC